MTKLDEARIIINECDKEIKKQFIRRMKASELVAEYKKEYALPIFDSSREQEVIRKNASDIEDLVIKEYYVNFLQSTMDISKRYQGRLIENMKVAYSGAQGAFASIAANRMFPTARKVAYKNFEEAYEAVEKGECDAVVLPVENSFAGDVGAVMDLIFSGSLFINQMIDLEVEHYLIAKPNTKKEDIKTVYSHPQALSQCAAYIASQGYNVVEATNTALAAKYVSESSDQTIAAIASKETAELYQLEVLDSKINTNRFNTTRFAAFSRVLNKPNPVVKMGEHFILVFTVINEAGALAKTLNIIGAHGFNMRNLRSRPMKELFWNYYFFVELEGNINTEDGQDMLRELGTVCDRLKLVGTYFSFANK